jgi:hypothetical protein
MPPSETVVIRFGPVNWIRLESLKQ